MMRVRITLHDEKQISFDVYSRTFTIGRSQSCTIVLPYDFFSRQHCLVEIIDDSYFITDLGSANGVSINGQRIAPNVQTPFKVYEPIHIGDAAVLFDDGISNAKMPLELGTRHEIKLNLPAKKKSYHNPIAGRSPRKRNRNEPEPVERKSLLDPVNVIVAIILMGAFYVYRGKMNTKVNHTYEARQTYEKKQYDVSE